jgi:flagellar hook-basal body complex protein FliE
MMSGLYVLAQVAGAVDPNTIGVSITSLIGSLGAAGAAVAVTYYFLGFLRTEGEKQSRVFGEFRDYHAESQGKFQDQLERLTDRHEQLQRAFQDQISRMTEIQNSLLRDAILAMKSVEKTLESSVQTIHDMERTITSLQFSVNGIDLIVRRMTDTAMVSRKSSPPSAVEEHAT